MSAPTTEVIAHPRRTAWEMVGCGRGILAADESITTMSARLAEAGVVPSEENRRAYREMLVTTPRLREGVSGVILCDETLRQRLSDGRTFPRALSESGMLPGIKVDTGAKVLAGAPGEHVTEGLDGLGERLAEYAELGARFAKWRAVITVGDNKPSEWALRANCHALARYARACQDAGIVPIVEPEVLRDGAHSLHVCAGATAVALMLLSRALDDAGVDPAATVLKPNMVVPGSHAPGRCGPEEVAKSTVDTLLMSVSKKIAGIAFLSGGQDSGTAIANLAAMQRLATPWPVTFSFGRALVSPALRAWRGEPTRVEQGQAALSHQVTRAAETLRAGPPQLWTRE
jgi:fructose-bisphosphate aldolase class I